MTPELVALAVTAFSVGVVHTLLGPDHYLPFVFMGRAGDWSRAKTLKVTLACGAGHVLGSVALGMAGIGLGVAVGRLEVIESFRGELAAWALIGFGLVYFIWGLRQASRNRPHTHAHLHANGTVHSHPHVHEHEHVHVHEHAGARRRGDEHLDDAPAASAARLTPWILFTIFVFGPCEPLIPLMMYPALMHGAGAVALVVVLYAVATLGTMVPMVLIFQAGTERLRFARLERHAHAMAGGMVMLCGVAIRFWGA